MTRNFKTFASLVLLSALTTSHAQTAANSQPEPGHKTARRAHRKPVEHRPSVETQIEDLRRDMDSQRTQIDALRQQLSDRDAQLQQAQQAAQQAQASAQQAQSAAQQQSEQLTDNAQAVSSLQGSVAALKTNTQSTQAMVTTVQTQQAQVRQMVENPDAIHYRGITLSPNGSFIEAATVNRTRATGSDIPTPFSSIPLTASDAGQLSEFYATGRQSRLALTAEGKEFNATLRGYYEMDWLGTGVTSNSNQSNSYVLRQRQLWAQAQFNNGWIFTGGQQWTLATEYTKTLLNKNEAVPFTIDPNYQVGFVWARQPGFRIVKDWNDKFWAGISAENAQDLTPACQATGTATCPTNYLIGSAGNGGGLYNSGGQPGATSSSPLALYSFNLAPDLIAKVAMDSPLAHFELFGLGRFFRDRVYPNEVGGKGSSTGAYNDTTAAGGIGGSARFHTYHKMLDVGLKGLYGEGVGRYGTSTLPDITLRPDGQLALTHGFSSMAFIEGNVTPRLQLYLYYGGDYTGRRYFAEGTGFEGYGVPNANNSGCGTESVTGTAPQPGYAPGTPANCAGNTKDTQEGTFGWWYNFYAGSHGRLRQGFQYSWVERNIWGGVGGSPAAIDNVFETSLRYYMP